MRESDPPGILWAVTASYTIGVLGGNLQPLLIGALIDGLHLEAARAGLLSSIELSAVALASFVLAPRMATIARRRLIRAGAAVAVFGYISSAPLASFPALALCRVLSGVGAGMVLSIGNAAVASCRHPDKVFAQTTIIGTVIITALLALLPSVIARAAYHGAYLSMGIIALLLLPALRWIPQTAGEQTQQAAAPPLNFALGIPTLAAAALLFLCQSAMWAFAERIALATAMPADEIGLALAASTLVGLAGAALATWMSTRGGRTVPLAVGVLLIGITVFGLAGATSARTYTLLLLVNGIAYLFMVPYVLGTAAALDRHGRWGAATIGAATIGAALGPGIGGGLVSDGAYGALGWLGLILSLISAAAITPVAWVLDRQRVERAGP